MTLNTRPSAALGTALVIMLLTAAALPWASRSAIAAAFTVTTTADSGAGTLRQAIIDANASPAADTISFSAATNAGSILLQSPLPTIANAGALTISGNGSANTVVSGNSKGLVFSVAAGATATISGMTILNGTGTSAGAVSNAGTLTLSGVTLRNNATSAGSGGAINNSGTLTLLSTIVSANSATNGGGIYTNGGTVTLTNSVVSGNQAGVGGGIFSFGGTLTLNNSTLNLNSGATGGGIFSNTTVTTISNSVIANSISGGGDCVPFQGTITIRSSLIEDGTCGITNGVNGNLTGDPLLNPDLTPAASSRTVDAGLNSLIPAGVTTDLAGNARIQGVRVDMGAYEFGGAAVPTSTPTNTPTATGTPLPGTPTATATATLVPTPAVAPNTLVLPLVARPLALPDLVVDQLSLDPATGSYRAGDPVVVTVRVTNIGDAPATGFWVDLYINPSAPPDASNQRWNERCGLFPCYGIAWPVTRLEAGASIVLTSKSFDPGQSIWLGSFAAGTTTLYAYADSFNAGVATGGVFERNETNNRLGPVGLRVTGSALLAVPEQVAPVLPPRQLP